MIRTVGIGVMRIHSLRLSGDLASTIGHAGSMAWTYLLECGDGSYYAGSTTDLDRRMHEHTRGLGAAYTARRQPVCLVWRQEFARIDEAYALEKKIQGWSRAKREALIDGRFEALPGLSRKPLSQRGANGDGGDIRSRPDG